MPGEKIIHSIEFESLFSHKLQVQVDMQVWKACIDNIGEEGSSYCWVYKI